jgi:hypothetical protein
MKYWVAVLFVVGGVFWSTAASAHWQNTKWGMSAPEVSALWPAAQEVEESGHYVLLITGPLDIGSVAYKEVRFVFDTKGKLRFVRLSTDLRYRALVDRMTAQMGPPVTDRTEKFFGSVNQLTAIFTDGAKGNTVRLSGFEGGQAGPLTLLEYRAIETGF